MFLNRPYDNENVNEWNTAEDYCLHAVNRFYKLQLALQTPSPQLGLQNIERIRGFAASLMVSRDGGRVIKA